MTCACGHAQGDHRSAGTSYPHPPQYGVCLVPRCTCRQYLNRPHDHSPDHHHTQESTTMRKTLATLAAALAVAAVAVAPASAKPGQFTTFSEDAAATGAQQFARIHMHAAGTGTFDPGLKVITDCMAVRTGINHRSSLWLCDVTTYQGRATEVGHQLVGVLRKDGGYVYRPYDLVPAANQA